MEGAMGDGYLVSTHRKSFCPSKVLKIFNDSLSETTGQIEAY